MHAFSRLLKTDLRNRRNTIFITLGIIVLLNIILVILPTLLNIPEEDLSFVLTLNITLFATIYLIPFIHFFSTWREEWKQQASYLLFSLPVPRTHLLFSKYFSILIETLLISGVMAAGLSMQNWFREGLLFRAEPLITMDLSKVAFIASLLLSFTCLVFLSFFSLLLGKCFRRISLLMTFLIFITGLLISILALSNLPVVLVLVFLILVYFSGSLYVLEKKLGIE